MPFCFTVFTTDGGGFNFWLRSKTVFYKTIIKQKPFITIDQSSIEEIYTKMSFAVMPDFKLQMIMSPWEIRKANYNLHSLNDT